MKEMIQRKSIRLKAYDYSTPGYYFITICVKGKQKELGSIVVGAGSTRPPAESCTQIVLSDYGNIVDACFLRISERYPNAMVDKRVIMPNHIHMILRLRPQEGDVENGLTHPAPTTGNAAIGSIIGYFKYQTVKKIGIPGFWQRSFHERIIRDEEEYQKIWEYIDANPLRWKEDIYFVDVGL